MNGWSGSIPAWAWSVKARAIRGCEFARVASKDLAGDDNHWAATVTSAAFKGKTRVAQHQMVYAALKGNMGGVLHALQLTTVAKD